MDRIDPLFFVNSSRINIKDETRINATSEEVAEWESEHRNPSGWHGFSKSRHLLMEDLAPAPNFISEIFFLTIATTHLGYIKTISAYNTGGKILEHIQRVIDRLQGGVLGWT